LHEHVYHGSKLTSALWIYFDEYKLIHQYNTRQEDDFTHMLLTPKVEKRQ